MLMTQNCSEYGILNIVDYPYALDTTSNRASIVYLHKGKADRKLDKFLVIVYKEFGEIIFNLLKDIVIFF